jgi:hypothetical protein
MRDELCSGPAPSNPCGRSITKALCFNHLAAAPTMKLSMIICAPLLKSPNCQEVSEERSTGMDIYLSLPDGQKFWAGPAHSNLEAFGRQCLMMFKFGVTDQGQQTRSNYLVEVWCQFCHGRSESAQTICELQGPRSCCKLLIERNNAVLVLLVDIHSVSLKSDGKRIVTFPLPLREGASSHILT